jgi:hypothetical protein
VSEPATAPTEPPCPPRSRAARLAWAQRLARFPGSGLSPAQFCAAEGVSLPSFYAWKRRLAAPELDPAAAPRAPAAGPRLLPVRLPAAAALAELVLPGGAVLRLPPGCDPAWVRSLAAALGGVPC